MRFEINEETLENKLTLFHTKVPSDDITLLANINAGPIYETDSNAGISHLIEHMLFKGTRKRASRDFIYNELGVLGGWEYS